MLRANLFLMLLITLVATTALATDDPYLWLEEVDGEKALSWVKERSTVEYPNISASGTLASMAQSGPSSWEPIIMPRRWFNEPITAP